MAEKDRFKAEYRTKAHADYASIPQDVQKADAFTYAGAIAEITTSNGTPQVGKRIIPFADGTIKIRTMGESSGAAPGKWRTIELREGMPRTIAFDAIDNTGTVDLSQVEIEY